MERKQLPLSSPFTLMSYPHAIVSLQSQQLSLGLAYPAP